MPFVTEEIWQTVAPRANIEGDTIMLRPYPDVCSQSTDNKAVADIEWVQQFILGIRQIRGEMDISPGKQLPVMLENSTARDRAFAAQNAHLLERVGRVESDAVITDGERDGVLDT